MNRKRGTEEKWQLRFWDTGKAEPFASAVWISYLLVGMGMLYFIFAFIWAFIWLDSRVFPVSPVFAGFLIVINAVLFPVSTLYEAFNYNNVKRLLLSMNYASICLLLLALLFHYTGVFIFPKVFSLKVTPFVSVEMIISLARISEGFIVGIPAYGMLRLWTAFLKNEDIMREVYFFRLSHYVDLRKDKGVAYDLHLGRNIENKTSVIIHEKDRYLQQTDNGAPGTGKSSLVMINGACQDMDTRQRNERIQKKLVRRLLQEGKIYRCAEADRFNICDFAAYPMYEEEWNAVKSRYRTAGQTILAPDASMLDQIYKLAKARGIPVRRIDPAIMGNGAFKEGFIGFNPLYIPPETAERQDIFYNIAVERRAALYRDVMQQLYLLDGNGGDAYFTGINKTSNYNMTVLCILTYPFLEGRQANPEDCLRELANLQPVEETETIETKDKNGNLRMRTVKRVLPNPRLLELLECYQTRLSDTVHQQFDLTFRVFFYNNFIENPESGKRIFEQSLGLRNLISGFVNNPFIRPILTASDDNTVSIPRALERGEILLFNFYQEMGSSAARVFGLFFLLEFDTEVKARPGTEDSRVPNFLRIDELPVILDPVVNTIISQYRKYRVAAEFAFQSLAQMGESQKTIFLANVMMTCGTQLVFGRCNLEEMERYNQLAGQYQKPMEQVSYAEGSFWSDTEMTRQVRTTAAAADVTTKESVRYRNFAECTIFGTRDGVPQKPVIVRFSFLNKRAYRNQQTKEDLFALSDIPVLECDEPEESVLFWSTGVRYTHEPLSIRPGGEETEEPKAEFPFRQDEAGEEEPENDNPDGFSLYEDITGKQEGEHQACQINSI